MIKATELCCSFNNKRVLNNLNLNIESGSFVAILGHNGSGKSTLVRHFNALITPESGTIMIDGMDTADKTNIFAIRQTVGMVFQNPESQSVTTIVEDDIAFGPENLGLDEEETIRRVNYALSACGIEHLRNRDISTLSGGQKQLTAIAGVIAMLPKYIIFDEATSMLDPDSRNLVLDCVAKLKTEHNISIIWITHNLAEAARADRVIELKNGEIITDSTPDSVDIQIPKESTFELPNIFTTPDCDEYALMLKNVSFSYPTQTGKITALKDVSVEIPKDKLTAIIGKTGSGKSTLAEILSGITKPNCGTATLCDNIRIVFQSPVFFEDTVYDEIAYSPKQKGLKGDELDSNIKQITKTLGIKDELLNKSPFNLSGGEQKLVSIATAISATPDVLILDEPTAGLDITQKKCVLELMQNLKSSKKTVVFITHSTEDAISYADNIILVNDGKIVGNPIIGGDIHAS